MVRSIPRLHLIGPLDVVSLDEYIRIALEVASAGSAAIHLRLPGAFGGDALRFASELQSRLDAFPDALLFVNDRLDVAWLSGADAVQLGERSFSVADARRLLSSEVIVGRSIHGLEGAIRAEHEGADFVLAGHVYETPSKSKQPGRGVEWLGRITDRIDIPVIAIGGVTAERVADIVSAGAYGVAMGRELLRADHPATRANDIHKILMGVRV